MTHRDRSREPLIIPTIIAQKGDDWNDETRKLVQADAQRVLEAMLAEFGVEGALRALESQGFKASAYHYLLKPLFGEAHRRRLRAKTSEQEQSNVSE